MGGPIPQSSNSPAVLFYNRVMNAVPPGYGRLLATSLLIVAGCLAFQESPLTGPQLVKLGRLDEALAVFRQDVEILPKSVAAHNGVGVVLDLMGRYPEAREAFSQAIAVASKPLDKALAQRAMAIARGFAGECKGAEKYESSAFDFYLNTSDFYNAGEVADELGRLCIDAGDFDRSQKWYERGHDTGFQEPNMTQAHRDLWNFRWDHAQARLAVRRGKIEQAWKLVASAKAILDKGTNPEQEEYFPYLTGYVAFYAGDYPRALKDLGNAAVADPFIQCLTAQVYEKMGDTANARIFYGRAASTSAHSVPAAFARPFALKKLAK